MKYVNFQFYRTNPDGVIWKKLASEFEFEFDFFIHQRMFVRGAEK